MTAPLLTVEQVAALLSVRPALVRTLAHRGELAYLRVGLKLMRFAPEAVDRYVAEHAVPARPARRRGVV